MKLYGDQNPAPNPRRVRIFLAEKNIKVEHERVSLREGAHKTPAFLEKNSLGQVPVLELDDGSYISESVSICRYLEETHPEPPLFGRDAKDKALIDMWCRRIELRLMIPIANIWRHTHPLTAALLVQYKDFGESNRPRIDEFHLWLNGEMKDRPFIAGDHYSIADIVALTAIDFGRMIGVDIPESCPVIRAWHARVSARPSAQA
nr:glutathione S-transferase family protein [uncultured Brevundimonas sp.]